MSDPQDASQEPVSPEAKADAAVAAAAGSGPKKAPKPAVGAGLPSDLGAAARLARPTVSLADIQRVSKQEGQDGTGDASQATQAVGGVRPDAIIGWTGARAFNTRYLDPPLGFEHHRPAKAATGERGADVKPGAPSDTKEPAAAPPPKHGKRKSLHEFAEFIGAPRTEPDTRTFAEVDADEIKQMSWESPLVTAAVPDKFLGFWWYQAAAALVTILFAWLAVRFRLGLCGALTVGAAMTVYWNAGMRRARQRARDQITRELQAKKMEDQFETMEWANFFLARFWPIFEPIISGMVVSQAEQQIPQYLPKFIESVRLSTFTLGSKPPRVNHVRTFPDTPDDVVLMDWKFSFTPHDNIDLTARQAANVVNPRIRISVKLGKGPAIVSLPIDVEDFTFTGYLRLRLKLVTNFPHVQIVDVTMLDPPYYDYVLKPVGGHTFGWDVNNLPGLTNFIKDQVNNILGPMVYAPNVFSLNVEELLAGQPLDAATGVVQVAIQNATDIKGAKFGGGKPDPYVALSIDDGEVQSRTKTISSTSAPTWKETQYALVRNLNGFLTLQLMDFNDHRPDTKLGTVSVPLDGLDTEPEREGQSSPVQLGGRYRGTLNYSIKYFPVLTATKGPDGQDEPIPESRSGIVRLSVYEAKGLKKRGLGEPSTWVRIVVDGKTVGESSSKKRTVTPNWAYTKEFLSTNRDASKVSIQVVTSDLGSSTVVGHVTKRLQDLISLKAKGEEWLDIGNGAKVRIATIWKPIAMTGGANGGEGYTPPIGTLKVWTKRAVDVKNVEAISGGKSDPYAQLRFRGTIVDRTNVQESNLDPVWNEILYSPVHSLSDTVVLEVLDFQNNGKHRPLGNVTIPVSELAEDNKTENEYPFKSLGRQQRKDMIAIGKNQYKGSVEYDVEFVPALNLQGVDFLAAHGGGEKEEEKPAPAPVPAVPKEGTDAEAKAAEAKAAEAKAPADKPAPKEGAKAGEDEAAEEPKEPEPEPVARTLPQLLESKSGMLAFNVLSAVVNKKTSIEMWFDESSWPTYQTEPSKSAGTLTLDDVHERVIRELGPSRFFIRFRKGLSEDDDDVYAQFEGSTQELLTKTFDKPATIPLAPTKGSSDGHSSVTLMCKYVPLPLTLEPAERFDNHGYLSVHLVSAANLRAADRGKSSDPYARILVDGERTAKSKTVKKTLDPDFNETLEEVIVSSRANQEVLITLNDWDAVGTSDPLGEARLDLSAVSAEPKTVTLPLSGEGAGENGPTVTLSLTWRAAWVPLASRGGPSGVAVPGQVGKAGIKAVGNVGKTAFSAPSKAFGLVRRHGRNGSSAKDEESGTDFESSPSGAGADGSPSPSGAPPVPPIPSEYTSGNSGSISPDTSSVFGSKRRSRLHNPFKK